MKIIHRKMKWDGEKVVHEQMWSAYLRYYAKKIPYHLEHSPHYLHKGITTLVTLFFASFCGFVLVAALPGFLVAGVIAVILSWPIKLIKMGNKDKVHPAKAAAVFVILGVIPLIVFCMGNGIDSPGAFMVWVLNYNIYAFQIAVAPFFDVLEDVLLFIFEIFGGEPQKMIWVVLASDDWNRGFVMAYHILLIAPLMIGLFAIGFNQYKNEATLKGKTMLVICMAVPLAWIIIWYKIVMNDEKIIIRR